MFLLIDVFTKEGSVEPSLINLTNLESISSRDGFTYLFLPDGAFKTPMPFEAVSNALESAGHLAIARSVHKPLDN